MRYHLNDENFAGWLDRYDAAFIAGVAALGGIAWLLAVLALIPGALS